MSLSIINNYLKDSKLGEYVFTEEWDYLLRGDWLAVVEADKK